MEILLLIIIGLVYFLPTIIAYARKHNNSMSISVANLLVGWTMLGWCASMIWACTSNVKTD